MSPEAQTASGGEAPGYSNEPEQAQEPEHFRLLAIENDFVVIRPPDIFDIGSAAAARKLLGALGANKELSGKNIVIDFADVSFLDTVAIATMLQARKKFPEQVSIILWHLEPGQPRTLIEKTLLGRSLTIEDDRQRYESSVSKKATLIKFLSKFAPHALETRT